MEGTTRRTRDYAAGAGAQDTRDTARLPPASRARSRPSVPPAPTGGTYSITTPPRSRGTAAPAPTPPPQPAATKVTTLPSRSIRIELAGREITLARRDARTLLDQLQRALLK